MTTKPSWHFPRNGGGLAAGFNDSSMDTFKGRRLSSLVREIVQNSLDARADSLKPVVVDFQFSAHAGDEVSEVILLRRHIELAQKTAKVQGLDQAVEFYDAALKVLDKKNKIRFLSAHDSNTSGLTGPIDGPNGAWYALTKGSGLTQKPTTSGSLGSFGHGSKAPFVSSAVRSVYYLSVVEDGNKKKSKEIRFQGKSILQSYELGKGKGMTQGTGFFGHEEECRPLLNEEVPEWALRLRTSRTQTTGTTIILPAVIWDDDSLKSISITTIANFFYAIKKGVLEVQVGHLERLTANNVEQKFQHYLERIEDASSEIDLEGTLDSFETIKTIVTPSHHGEQQIPNFGRIDWYLRLGPDIDTRYVSVARGNGMFITKKAPSLLRFPNLKPFDFFVCVTGEGSDTLKSLENPEHTNFEFERIDDPIRRKSAQKKYEILTKAVRDILKRLAEYSAADQVVIDDLQDLFSDISAEPNSTGGTIERGPSIQIANGNYTFKPRQSDVEKRTPGDEAPSEIPGRGDRSGNKKKQTEGGGIAADDGKLKIVGPSKPADNRNDPPKVVKLKNLRMRPSVDCPGETVIFFDANMSGPASIRLVKSGEIGSEPLNVIIDGKPTNAFDLELEKDKRMSVSVKFPDKNVDFAIEGEAYEIKS